MPKKVLVVDDERNIVRLIQVNLERAGYEVVTAYDGKEALERLKHVRPDLIVLDVMMPNLNGLETLKEVRANPDTRSIPVIMLTALGQESDRVVGLEYGADDYVVKPFSPRELALRVDRVLARSRGTFLPVQQGPCSCARASGFVPQYLQSSRARGGERRRSPSSDRRGS